MTTPYEQFFRQQIELHHALERMRPMLDFVDLVPRFHFDVVDQLDRLRQQLTFPTEYLASLQRIHGALDLNPVLESFQLISALDSEAVRALQRQQSEIGEILKTFASPITEFQAMQRTIESVASTEALLGLHRLSESSVEMALQPQLAFQEFAKRNLELAMAGSEIGRQNRLLIVDASADLLYPISRGLDLAALMRPTNKDLWKGSIRRVNVYSALDQELEGFDLERGPVDAESVVEESLPGKIAELGGELVQLVYDLNVESEREGHAPMFKPTTKALMACALVPSRVAFDSSSFGEIIDSLFFLLYEGSGSAQRLAARCDKSRLEPLWTLKHLRLGSRHDVNHGTERDALKKNHQVGEAYMRLVGRVAPRTKSEWMTAQVVLYKDLVEMLEHIWYGDGD